MQEKDTTKYRLRNRELKRDCRFLGDLVNRFFHLLSMKPQPTDKAVRKRFMELNTAWEEYCTKRGLDLYTRDLFKHDVEIRWESLKKNS